MMDDGDIRELRRQVGKRVRGLRKLCHLTQDDLAYDLCIDRSRISRIETGRCSLTFDEMVALAEEFGLEPADLLGGLQVTRVPEDADLEGGAPFFGKSPSGLGGL